MARIAKSETARHKTPNSTFNVTRRWMDLETAIRRSTAGGRAQRNPPFWVNAQAGEGINPDAYTTGEIWDAAEAWLDGRHFDAVMNYPFARAALYWIGNKKDKITASECDRRLAELRIAYPAAATYVMQNLMDSHDTDRLVSMIANPDRLRPAEPGRTIPIRQLKPNAEVPGAFGSYAV